ncbi:hypothetical protein [Kribbella sp. NPDC051620]|uniref:hypothetical protein n=1 Tax=Kribbella sp. NPDC051620 TaxID=3364120 RepID=UPI00378E2885
MLSCKAWGRLIAVLLLYPLMATTVALDALWITAYDRHWPPGLYTVAALLIAGAVSTSRQRLSCLPPAACLAVGAVGIGLANVAMIVATAEVASTRQYSAAVVALVMSGLTLVLTALACRLGEVAVEARDAQPVRRTEAVDTQPTLIDPVLAEQALAELVRAADLRTATLIDLDEARAA